MKFIIYSALRLLLINSIAAQTTYYINHSQGNDANTGTAKNRAWKTMQKVNSVSLQPGDSVLFKGGETWRWPLIAQSGNTASMLYYGAFDFAEQLPVLTFSLNMNHDASWVNMGDNIWLCTYEFPIDVGNIIFDNEDHAGHKVMASEKMLKQDDFYYNLTENKLYLYSHEKPNDLYNSIECALRYNVVHMDNIGHVTFENLAVKYGAAHGFGGSNTHNTIVRNCEISWIGGGDLDLDGQRRFGNALEFWENASNNLVENNKIWEIYDTGLTNQGKEECIQENIIYRNNVIWNCGLAAFEIWNKSERTITKNITIANNTCVNMGYGWGAIRKDKLGSFFAEFYDSSKLEAINIVNNIAGNTRFFYVFEDDEMLGNINLKNNCYFGSADADTLVVFYAEGKVLLAANFEEYQSYVDDEWESIMADPLFLDTKAFNFELKHNSPCIETGYSIDLWYDHNMLQRPQGLHIDMGAFEYEFTSTLINYAEYEVQVYPNPSFGRIRITADYLRNVKVFNIWGQLVLHQSSNNNTLELNLESGVYLLKVITENNEANKLVVVN